jgi:hypothetical protein
MRRTSARQPCFPIHFPGFARVHCHRCGRLGVRIVQLGLTTNGALERAWCGPDCAQLDGWPWLISEVSRRDARRDAARATG